MDQPSQQVSLSDSQLAVILRQVQWSLDDAAFNWATQGATPDQRRTLVVSLRNAATLVEGTIPGEQPLPIMGRPYIDRQ